MVSLPAFVSDLQDGTALLVWFAVKSWTLNDGSRQSLVLNGYLLNEWMRASWCRPRDQGTENDSAEG